MAWAQAQGERTAHHIPAQLCQQLGGTQDKPLSPPALIGFHLLNEQVGQMFFLSP